MTPKSLQPSHGHQVKTVIGQRVFGGISVAPLLEAVEGLTRLAVAPGLTTLSCEVQTTRSHMVPGRSLSFSPQSGACCQEDEGCCC